MACAVRGLPGVRRGYVQRRRTRSACQRSKVCGEMTRRSWRRCPLGSSRASAARIARSAQDSFGVPAWRWSTATWWRKIKISASLAWSERASKASQPNTRSTVK